MRKFVAASVVLLVVFAVAVAEEFTASITKFEGGKITVKKFKGFGKDAPPPEEVTLSVADNVKIVNGNFNRESKKIEAGDALEGGKDALAKRVKESAERAKKAADGGKKGFGFGLGVLAAIITEGEGASAKVTEIRVTKGFGGKKKDN